MSQENDKLPGIVQGFLSKPSAFKPYSRPPQPHVPIQQQRELPQYVQLFQQLQAQNKSIADQQKLEQQKNNFLDMMARQQYTNQLAFEQLAQLNSRPYPQQVEEVDKNEDTVDLGQEMQTEPVNEVTEPINEDESQTFTRNEMTHDNHSVERSREREKEKRSRDRSNDNSRRYHRSKSNRKKDEKTHSDHEKVAKLDKLYQKTHQQMMIFQSQQAQQQQQQQQSYMLTVQLQSRLKDLEFDNFRLERKLQETLSRQWRIESLFNNYVFKDLIKDQFESSQNFLEHKSVSAKDLQGKTYHIHFVDYLQTNCFKRIQDAIDASQNFDKIIVNQGIYHESIYVDKQVSIISNGFVELRSFHDNVITCQAQNEGCLIKGFSIRRLDNTKGDPLSTGACAQGEEDKNEQQPKKFENRRKNQNEDCYGGRKNQQSNNDFQCENKFAIYIKEGKAYIEECDMQSECGTVVFCNPRSYSKLVKNRICGSIGSGIMATGKHCRVEAEENQIYGGTGCGIDIRNNASCLLVKNKIHNCDKSGIYILMTLEAKIYRNEISENHFSGIEVTNAQKVEIINNKICQNKRAGLYFHTESVVFCEKNEIVENKNANIIMKEKSKVAMIHNYIARSVGSGLVILTGSGCKFEHNVIRDCQNNGIDLCNGDIYATNNVIVNNERSGLYGNGHIKGSFVNNKIIYNKLQAWNNGLCKYIMDQDGKGNYNLNTDQMLNQIKHISKERFVMYRNIDDCEMKGIMQQKGNMDPQEREWNSRMQTLLKQLDKQEKEFFIPENAEVQKRTHRHRSQGRNQHVDRRSRSRTRQRDRKRRSQSRNRSDRKERRKDSEREVGEINSQHSLINENSNKSAETAPSSQKSFINIEKKEEKKIFVVASCDPNDPKIQI